MILRIVLAKVGRNAPSKVGDFLREDIAGEKVWVWKHKTYDETRLAEFNKDAEKIISLHEDGGYSYTITVRAWPEEKHLQQPSQAHTVWPKKRISRPAAIRNAPSQDGENAPGAAAVDGGSATSLPAPALPATGSEAAKEAAPAAPRGRLQMPTPPAKPAAKKAAAKKRSHKKKPPADPQTPPPPDA